MSYYVSETFTKISSVNANSIKLSVVPIPFYRVVDVEYRDGTFFIEMELGAQLIFKDIFTISVPTIGYHWIEAKAVNLHPQRFKKTDPR